MCIASGYGHRLTLNLISVEHWNLEVFGKMRGMSVVPPKCYGCKLKFRTLRVHTVEYLFRNVVFFLFPEELWCSHEVTPNKFSSGFPVG